MKKQVELKVGDKVRIGRGGITYEIRAIEAEIDFDGNGVGDRFDLSAVTSSYLPPHRRSKCIIGQERLTLVQS